MQKHILVVSQYFYPEQFRVNDICVEWVKRGYQVTVVTGIPNYPKGKFFDGYGLLKGKSNTYYGVDIVRIPIIPRGSNVFMLALNYASFVISGFFWQLFTSVKADYVYIYEVSPMTQALPGVWYSKKKKIPCYLYVTDLWPENVEIIAGIKNKKILNTIGVMVDYIYKRCDRIFTSSKGFIAAITKRGVENSKLEYWPQYAEDYYYPVKAEDSNVKNIPQDGKFNIIFAGNLGYAQGLDILPAVAIALKESGLEVRFNMIGDGRYKEELMAAVNDNQVVDMFNFIGIQPPSKIPEFMAQGEAALICLARNEVFSITLPAKTQSCLACGIPIIVSADGEVQNVIQSAGAGVYSDAGDVDGLIDSIKELMALPKAERVKMARNGIEYSYNNFDKTKLLDRMDHWFD